MAQPHQHSQGSLPVTVDPLKGEGATWPHLIPGKESTSSSVSALEGTSVPSLEDVNN